MKRAARFLALAALLLLVSATSAATTLDTDYDLSWWTVDGGGNTSSTGEGYTLGGTAGQPDAGVLAGEGYTLAGGFWGSALAGYRIYLPLMLRSY
jgi:hypothetical protein